MGMTWTLIFWTINISAYTMRTYRRLDWTCWLSTKELRESFKASFPLQRFRGQECLLRRRHNVYGPKKSLKLWVERCFQCNSSSHFAQIPVNNPSPTPVFIATVKLTVFMKLTLGRIIYIFWSVVGALSGIGEFLCPGKSNGIQCSQGTSLHITGSD